MKNMQWQEPVTYSSPQPVPNKQRIGYAAFIFVALLLIRFTSKPDPAAGINPPGWGISIVVAIIGTVFFTYVLPLLISNLPTSSVILWDKGINNNRLTGIAWNIRFWAWDKIGSFGFGNVTLKNKEFRCMHIFGPNGSPLVSVTLGNRISEAEITQYMAENGKSLANSQIRHP
ncbi:MAG: hypothetical protein ABJA67_01410 [Chthonomonadales bacterium]